jgi:hypothetical protein
VSALSAAELNDFGDAVDGVLAKHWPHPGEAQAAIADADVLNLLWQQAIRQGWADLSTDHALDGRGPSSPATPRYPPAWQPDRYGPSWCRPAVLPADCDVLTLRLQRPTWWC